MWLFNLTIIFAVVYLVLLPRLRTGEMRAAEYKEEMKLGAELKAAAMGEFETSMASLQPSKDPLVLADGKATFLTLCAPCHRADGGGLVGPNLCDDYWIHGSNFSITCAPSGKACPAKGMITWKNYLKPGPIYAVASYIYTLRGTHPKNPKPPENQAPAKTGPSEFE